LSYRDTFLMLADHGVYPKEFAERIANSAALEAQSKGNASRRPPPAPATARQCRCAR